MLTFQQIILKLQQYWDAQGCALLQPYDMEVGAGTSHTATYLRAIGPEPWKAAYVQWVSAWGLWPLWGLCGVVVALAGARQAKSRRRGR